jgi:hypothetical protein
MWDLNRNEFVREIEATGGGEVRAAKISAATGDIILCAGRFIKLYSLNGDALLARDVCDEKDPADYVTACAWYEGVRGEWVEKILLLTGHRNGATKVSQTFLAYSSLEYLMHVLTSILSQIWHRIVDPQTGKWSLVLLRRLSPTAHAHAHHGPPLPEHTHRAAITCILPMSHAVFAGDDAGRVVSVCSSLPSLAAPLPCEKGMYANENTV